MLSFGDITVFHGCTACNPVQLGSAHLTPVYAEDLLLRIVSFPNQTINV